MPDVVSCAEIEGQYVELLQARTLLQAGSILGDLTTVVNDVATLKLDSNILSGNSASANSAPGASPTPSDER